VQNHARSHARPGVQPRLLSKADAAAYCAISTTTFEKVCPVTPVSLGAGKRLNRYDVPGVSRQRCVLERNNCSSIGVVLRVILGFSVDRGCRGNLRQTGAHDHFRSKAWGGLTWRC
jgi:hypothetical protein